MPQKTKSKRKMTEITTPSLPVIEAYVFDGKAYAAKRERELAHKAHELTELLSPPKVAAIITQPDPASQMYVRMKQKAAERAGIHMDVYEVARRDYHYVLNLIGSLNRDETVHGIMVQLPLAPRLARYRGKILNAIAPQKDVDGLRDESVFVPATVRAIISIIEEAGKVVLLRKPPPVFVVGTKGTVGSALVTHLKAQGYQVSGYDKNKFADWRDTWGVPSFMSLKADVVVSTTGTPGIIEARHIAKGAAVIDVGSPEGDVRFKEVKAKASFITPVPGGVGPVTIVSLLENVIEAAYNILSVKSHSDE